MRHRINSIIVGLCLCFLISGCETTDVPDFEPVSLESGSNAIRLQLVGRFSGGFFDLTSTTPPAYDPVSRRLFVPRTDVGLIDVLDLSDPAKPSRMFQIQTLVSGGQPISLDVKKGILAVALRRLIKSEPGRLAFFTVDGERIGRTVGLGAQPNMIAFIPEPHTLLIVVQPTESGIPARRAACRAGA